MSADHLAYLSQLVSGALLPRRLRHLESMLRGLQVAHLEKNICELQVTPRINLDRLRKQYFRFLNATFRQFESTEVCERVDVPRVNLQRTQVVAPGPLDVTNKLPTVATIYKPMRN